VLDKHKNIFNVYGSVHPNNILEYNSNKMHKSQNLFNLTTALHVSGVTIAHFQEHKTNASTASGNHYTVIKMTLSITVYWLPDAIGAVVFCS
jgi:hypothetical protein